MGGILKMTNLETIADICIICTCVLVVVKTFIGLYKDYRFARFQNDRLEELKELSQKGLIKVEKKEDEE